MINYLILIRVDRNIFFNLFAKIDTNANVIYMNNVFCVFCQMETRKIFAKNKLNINFQEQFETLITATEFACS